MIALSMIAFDIIGDVTVAMSSRSLCPHGRELLLTSYSAGSSSLEALGNARQVGGGKPGQLVVSEVELDRGDGVRKMVGTGSAHDR